MSIPSPPPPLPRLPLTSSVTMVLGLASILSAQCTTSQGNASLDLLGHPAIGNPIALAATGAPLARAVLLVDDRPGPVFLPPIGTFCVGLTPRLVGIPHRHDAQGRTRLGFTIPANPAVVGTGFATQDLTADPLAPNGFLALSNRVAFSVRNSTLVFAEDFESYALGDFQYPNGWQRYWGVGAGRIVSNTGCGTTSRALELRGASCYANVAYHPVKLGPYSRFECCVTVVQTGSPGCNPAYGGIGFWSPPPAHPWGCIFGGLLFFTNGTIGWQNGQSIGLKYQVGRSYRFAVVLDIANGRVHCEVDGVPYLDYPLPRTGCGARDVPQGIQVSAGQGSAPIFRFDSIRVYSQ